MDRFIVNGYLWKVHTVNPRSHYLVDRSGVLTVRQHYAYICPQTYKEILRSVF